MEYLMTYGWAIVVVMVTGIALWQLGIFNLDGQTSTTSVGFPRIKPQVTMVSVNESGYVLLTFTNGGGGPVNVLRVTCGNMTLTTPTDTVAYGANFDVNGTCPVNGGHGDPYLLDMLITYNTSIAGETQTHTDKGTIRGPIE